MDAYKALQPGCADLISSGTLELSHLSHPSPSPSPGSFNWFPEEAPAAPATQVEVVEAELTDAQEFFWQELTVEELSERRTCWAKVGLESPFSTVDDPDDWIYYR